MNDESDGISVNQPIQEDGRLGLVYLLSRSSIDAVVKIGFTSKTAERRATNYTDGEWLVKQEYQMPVWLARMTEKAAHEKLARYWLDPKITGGSASEIFTCTTEVADVAIREAYAEQFELTLRHLRLPDGLIKILFKLNSIERLISPSVDITDIFEIANEALRESDFLKLQIQSLERKLLHIRSQSEARIESADKISLQLKADLVEAKTQLRATNKKVEGFSTDLERTTMELKGLRDKYSESMEFVGQFEEIKSLLIGRQKIIKDLNRFANRRILSKEFESVVKNLNHAVNILNELILLVKAR